MNVQGYRGTVFHLHDGFAMYSPIQIYGYRKTEFQQSLLSSQLYNPTLSIALQVIYTPTPKGRFIFCFADVVKCAANHAMAMGLGCTADFQTVNHPNCSFSFPSCQRFATVGSLQRPRPGTDAMSCHSNNRSHRSLKNAHIRRFVIPEVLLPTKGF